MKLQIKIFVLIIVLNFVNIHSQTINIVIDASASMKGYVNKQINNSAFSYFIWNIPSIFNNYNEIAYYSLGKSVNKISKSNAKNAALNKSFFYKSATNYFSLLHKIKSEDDVYILFTDGVLSDAGSDLQNFTQEINKKINNGLVCYIIAIKSNFNGRIYPEYLPNQPSFKFRGQRPFLVCFMGHNEQKVNKIFVIFKNFMEKYRDNLKSREIKICPINYPTLTIRRSSEDKIEVDKIVYDNSEHPIFILTQDDNNNFFFINRSPLDDVENGFQINIELTLNDTNVGTNLFYTKIKRNKYCQYKNGKIVFNQDFIEKINKDKKITVTIEFETSLKEIENFSVWDDLSTIDDTQVQNAGKILNLSRLLTSAIKHSLTLTNVKPNIKLFLNFEIQ